MANYIDREILAEAYTHLEVESFSTPEEREKLKRDLIDFLKPRAKFVFGNEIDIEIEFEDGSLKTKIAFIAPVAIALGTIIGGYSSFREGARDIAQDAYWLAQAANFDVIYRTQASACDRLRVEKRPGIFGRANALINELESIMQLINDEHYPSTADDVDGVYELIARLDKWSVSADKLLAKLGTVEAKGCIASGLYLEAKKLPNDFGWNKVIQSPLKKAAVSENPQLLGKLSGAPIAYKNLREKTLQLLKTIADENAVDAS